MAKREQYKISFQKSNTQQGNIYYLASTPIEDNIDIANQLTYSNKADTINQIEFIKNSIDRTQKNLSFRNDFCCGEYYPPSFYIFPLDNTVEIGDGDTIISLEDFTQLLKEWLKFISE